MLYQHINDVTVLCGKLSYYRFYNKPIYIYVVYYTTEITNQ